MIQCECLAQMLTTNDKCPIHGLKRPRGIRKKLGLVKDYTDEPFLAQRLKEL